MLEVHPDVLRLIAKSKGIDMATIKGSGPNGKATPREIELEVLWGPGYLEQQKSST